MVEAAALRDGGCNPSGGGCNPICYSAVGGGVVADLLPEERERELAVADDDVVALDADEREVEGFLGEVHLVRFRFRARLRLGLG